MTLQQLRVFLSIFDFGSFRRAARELGVSQAGLTNSLKALETELQTCLLQRSARGVSLTADGERLLPRARLIDREARRVIEEAQSARGPIGGALHVGFGPTATATLLPLVLPDFHARFPSVKLHLASGFYEHLLPPLQQGLIELAVTAVPQERAVPGIASKVLFKSDLVVVGRLGHPRSAARSLHELVDCEWILLGSPGGPGATVIPFFTELSLPEPHVAATCETSPQLASLIAGTDWLALLPSALIERGLLGTPIVQIKLKEKAPQTDNCLLYRTDPPLTPAASSFAAMCESCARIMASLGPRPR